MIISRKFNVEGSLYGSEVSLFYGSRRLISLDHLQGDRTSSKMRSRRRYNSRLRALYDVRSPWRWSSEINRLEP